MNKDYYQALGIRESATVSEIKDAYRRLSKKIHPDMNQGDKFFEDYFKAILEAYEILSDLNKRAEYDNVRKTEQSFNEIHINNLEFEIHRLKALEKELRAKISVLSNEKFDIQGKLKSCELSYSSIRKNFEQIVCENRDYRIELNNVLNQKQSLLSQISRLEKENKDVAKKLEVYGKENESYESVGFSILGCVLFILFLGYSNDYVSFGKESRDNMKVDVVNTFKKEKEELENILVKASKAQPFIIDDIEFVNSGEKGVYKNTFYGPSIRYISLRLKVIVLNKLNGTDKLLIKYIEPDGNIMSNSETSPAGYTKSLDVKYWPNREYIDLGGWGNPDEGIFMKGRHCIEIFNSNNKLIGRKFFFVD